MAGSHKWPKPILPTRWLAEDSFYPNQDDYMPVPDPDAEAMEILEWAMEPGDAVAFSFGSLHGARGNESNRSRRAFVLPFGGAYARPPLTQI